MPLDIGDYVVFKDGEDFYMRSVRVPALNNVLSEEMPCDYLVVRYTGNLEIAECRGHIGNRGLFWLSRREGEEHKIRATRLRLKSLVYLERAIREGHVTGSIKMIKDAVS